MKRVTHYGRSDHERGCCYIAGSYDSPKTTDRSKVTCLLCMRRIPFIRDSYGEPAAPQ